MKIVEENGKNLTEICSLNNSKIFTYDQAHELISLLSIVSTKTKRELNILNSQLSVTKKNSQHATEIQHKINHCLQSWSDKMRRLGTHPISMGKVKILGEKEYYIWEYPQKNLIIQ